MLTVKVILILLGGYLLGSIPSGVWIGKLFYKKDIRNFGSGNMGTTNAFRVLGKRAGIVVFLMDMLKGSAAVALAIILHAPFNPLLAGIAAIIGHVFPLFANFKGGKAVATSAGALLVYNPVLFVIGCALFAVTLYLTSMVSMASLTCFVVVTILAFLMHDYFLGVIGLLVTIFVFIRHRQNIKRIENGAENMVSFGLGYHRRQQEHKEK